MEHFEYVQPIVDLLYNDDTPTDTDAHDEGDFRDNIVKFKLYFT